MTQRIELLAVSPGEFRPHNIVISRFQAIRLLKSLKIVLRQSAGVLLLGFGLFSVAGCSAEVQVVTEKTAPRADAETAPPATEKRAQTAVAVDIFGGGRPKAAEEQPPATEPAAVPASKAAEEGGRTANPTVVIVENRLHVHEHVHFHEAPRSERVEIEIRRYDAARDEECERRHRAYEAKVRELRRMFNQ